MVGQTISHYRITQKLGEGGQRTMIGALVAVLLLTAGQAMAQLTSEGNRFWSQDSDGIAGQAERGDDFGGALATGDFNNDGFEDLAIGVHGEDDGAGAVNVIYGGPAGLATPGNQFWHQDIPGILGEAERRGDGVLEFDPFGDNFGSALAAGDFNNDGFDDLAIGVSGEDIERILGDENAVGVVNVIYGGPAGLAAPGNQLWRQGRNGIEGGGEARDFFGTALAAGDFDNNGVDDLAIGVSGEDVGGIQNAGAVNVIYGGSGGLVASGNQIWHQDSDGIAGQAEGTDFFGDADRFGSALAAGDFDNDGFADLAIGVPGEDTDAGAVNVIYGGPEGLAPPGNQIWAQHSDDIVGGAREGDNFGRTLTAGDFNSDLFEDLAIGVPGEGSGTGAVNVIYGGSDGLAAPGNQIWSQNSDGIAGEGEEGDNFGGALAAGHFNRDGFADLAIGVFGAVNVIYGGRDGLAAPGNQIWNRDSDGIAVVEGGGLW